MTVHSYLMRIVLLLLLAASPARGQVVATYDTGVDNNRALLADGAVDPHFALVQYPGQSGSSTAPSYALGGITSSYDVSGSASRWISWSPTWVNATPSGVWVYRTTFDLTGFSPDIVALSGRFWSDDDGALVLNGATKGVTSTSSSTATPFSISSGFVAGVNTLDFQVVNAPFVSFNPSALRAEYAVTAVPEPSAAALSACAIAWGWATWAGRLRRRRRQAPGQRLCVGMF